MRDAQPARCRSSFVIFSNNKMSICRHSSISWSLSREAALPLETRFSGLCRYGRRKVKIRVNIWALLNNPLGHENCP